MTFRKTLDNLKASCNKYDAESHEQKSEFLKQLSTKNILLNQSLVEYHNLLLFCMAHPSDARLLAFSENELARVTARLKKATKKERAGFQNSGLPFTETLSMFSHDLLSWILERKKLRMEMDSLYKGKISLSDALQFTLPALEKEIATIGYNNRELCEALKIEKKQILPFLISEFGKLHENPFIKDYLFNGLNLYVKLSSGNKAFSKAYNRLAVNEPYFHSDNLKQFDQNELLNRKLPHEKVMAKTQLEDVIAVIKNSLTLLQRETDPVTFMDLDSFRLFELERGISIAIYGMTPERQLPLESYVGYTLFKNGFPAAYGGGWVFGKRSLFGINIFEAYRGGESGYMMCQLLRVYRQTFGVDYFEVEPYQYGAGNPEGIKSGAYWFYFRFGFRSLDKELNVLSLSEAEKIRLEKGYRSSEDVLVRFTESNVALNMGKGIPLTVGELREKVTALIASKYGGNRQDAEEDVVLKFLKKVGKQKPFSKEQKKVLAEVSFFCEVMMITSSEKIKGLYQLVLTKPQDLFQYQKLLVKIIK